MDFLLKMLVKLLKVKTGCFCFVVSFLFLFFGGGCVCDLLHCPFSIVCVWDKTSCFNNFNFGGINIGFLCVVFTS